MTKIPYEFRRIVNFKGENLRFAYEVFCCIASKQKTDGVGTCYQAINPPGVMVDILEHLGLLERIVDPSEAALRELHGIIIITPTQKGTDLYSMCMPK